MPMATPTPVREAPSRGSSYNYPTTVNAGSGSTAERVSLSYGPDRGRWQQQSYVGNSTQETTDYVGGLLEVVSSGGVTDYRHYINAGGEQIAVYSRRSNGTNTFSYLLSDHQASVASITNSSGGVVVGENFTPFGSRRNPRLPGRSNRSAEPGRRADDCRHPRYSSDSRVGRGTVRDPDRGPVLVREFKPRAPDRRRLLCHWRRDGDARVVCVWEYALARSGSVLRRSGRALTRSSSTVSRSDPRRGE